MHEHSEAAWKIASLYSKVLASETRDLAAHIDAAIAAERERCAKVAGNRLRAISDGLRGPKRPILVVVIDEVEAAIRAPGQRTP